MESSWLLLNLGKTLDADALVSGHSSVLPALLARRWTQVVSLPRRSTPPFPTAWPVSMALSLTPLFLAPLQLYEPARIVAGSGCRDCNSWNKRWAQ